jgi:hypothetical protein
MIFPFETNPCSFYQPIEVSARQVEGLEEAEKLTEKWQAQRLWGLV